MTVVQYRRPAYTLRSPSCRGVRGWIGGVWSWAWFQRAWWQAVHALRVLEAKVGVLKLAHTLAAFTFFLLTMPLLLFVYTIMKVFRKWGSWLAQRQMTDVEEVAQVTARTCLDTSAHPGTATLLLALEGTPSISLLQEMIQKVLIEQRDETTGLLVHPNLQRRLEHVCGTTVWRHHTDFDIRQHVIAAPPHHRGTSITVRNIQEYVSEVCSEPLPANLPPWRVTVVTARGGTEGEPVTYLIIRAHHLLAEGLTLRDVLDWSHPDPWRKLKGRGNATVLSAPSSIRRLTRAVVQVMKKGVVEVIEKWEDHIELCRKRKTVTMGAIMVLLWVITVTSINQMSHVVALVRSCYSWQTFKTAGVQLIAATLGAPQVLALEAADLGLTPAAIKEKLHQTFAFRTWVSSIAVFLRPLMRLMFILIWTPFRVLFWLQWAFRREDEPMEMIIAALVEVYWMARAFISLPRLLLEEILTKRGEPPFLPRTRPIPSRPFTRGFGTQEKLSVSWSDEVPLSTALGVRGATGASLSAVLLTATTGALRDYLRVTGLPVPDTLSCTLPVHSERWAEGRRKRSGLLPFSLPTGFADAKAALHEVRTKLRGVRQYPVRYLASLWLLENAVFFMPESLLFYAFRKLAPHYPVSLSNIAGPEQPVYLWGHRLLNIFYWRPTQGEGALAACVVTYCGRAHLGVLAERRNVPQLAVLPQAFVTHLNELAVNSGVSLPKCSSHSCSRSSSPLSTPPITPPNTPASQRTRKLTLSTSEAVPPFSLWSSRAESQWWHQPMGLKSSSSTTQGLKHLSPSTSSSLFEHTNTQPGL